MAALFCSCKQQHPIWGSSGGLKESTSGCFSTNRTGVKHTAHGSHTAPAAACALSAETSTWLRARDNWFPRRGLLGFSVNRGNGSPHLSVSASALKHVLQ